MAGRGRQGPQRQGLRSRHATTTTLDGLRIEPLCTTGIQPKRDESGFPVSTPDRGPRRHRARTASGTSGTRTVHPDPAIANAQILEDLANGATSIEAAAGPRGGGGRGIRTPGILRVLDGVVLEAAPVSLRAGRTRGGRRGLVPGVCSPPVGAWCGTVGLLGLDPVGTLASTGEVAMDAQMRAGWRSPTRPEADVPGVGDRPPDAGPARREIGYAFGGLCTCGPSSTTGGQPRFPDHAGGDRRRRRCSRPLQDPRPEALLGDCPGEHGPADRQRADRGGVGTDRWLTQVDPWVNILRGQRPRSGPWWAAPMRSPWRPFDSAHPCRAILGDGSPATPNWCCRTVGHRPCARSRRRQLVHRGVHRRAGGSRLEVLPAHRSRRRPVDAADEIGTDIAVVAARRDKDIATRKRPITGVSEFRCWTSSGPETGRPACAGRPPAGAP